MITLTLGSIPVLGVISADGARANALAASQDNARRRKALDEVTPMIDGVGRVSASRSEAVTLIEGVVATRASQI